MKPQYPPPRPEAPPTAPPAEDPPPLASADILRGAREVAIRHAGETYRLRVTSNDRLILTK